MDKRLLNDVAGTMLDAWEKSEGKPINVSYVATIADMARAVIKEYNLDGHSNHRTQAREVRR